MDESMPPVIEEHYAETTNIVWEIRNIAETLEFSRGSISNKDNDNLKLLVQMGKYTNKSSLWEFLIGSEPGGTFGLYLRLIEAKGWKLKPMAKFNFYILKPNGSLYMKHVDKQYNEMSISYGYYNVINLQNLHEAGVLTSTKRDLEIHLKLYVKRYEEPAATLPATNGEGDEYGFKNIHEVLSFSNSEDFVIKVMNPERPDIYEEMKTHKCILAARCPVLERIFEGNPEHDEDFQDSVETDALVIRDIKPKSVQVFLDFICHGHLMDDWYSYFEDLVYAARKYEVTDLLESIENKLVEMCHKKNAKKLKEQANQYQLKFALRKINSFIEDSR